MGGRRYGVRRDIKLWCQVIKSRNRVPIEGMMLGSCNDDSDEYEFDDGVEECKRDAVGNDALRRVNLFSHAER